MQRLSIVKCCKFSKSNSEKPSSFHKFQEKEYIFLYLLSLFNKLSKFDDKLN